jgi:hypothetical protein
MKTKVTQSKTGKSVLVTFHEGFSTYTITIPMPYAIRFFAEGLLSTLQILSEREELRSILSCRDGEKAHIQEVMRKAGGLYDGFLKAM